MEEEVALACRLMEEGAGESPEDLVEVLGVKHSHFGQTGKGVLARLNRLM